LSDRTTLASMPEGSLAHAYLDYLGGDDMGSAEYFLEAAGLDEKARRFGWSDDQLWFVRRMTNSHDLFHVVGGYGRDITGEVGVLCFTAGQVPLLPLPGLPTLSRYSTPTPPPKYFWEVAIRTASAARSATKIITPSAAERRARSSCSDRSPEGIRA
jgi:hypothetical protein